MHQGERRSSDIDLCDDSYDGIVSKEDGHMSGGLGQLTDGEEGQSNYRLDPKGLGIKGYEWVGWRNDTLGGGRPVEIQFKFDAVRNFTSLRIHCNNMFGKEVRVFRMARVSFSVGGSVFTSPPPVEFRYMRDGLIEYAREVVIPLQHGIGRYVRVELHFESRWMMMSEVQFESGEQ